MHRAMMIVCALALVTIVSARADEEKIELKKVPKAVTETFKARFKDAKPTGASSEKEGDKVVYEITFKDKGKNVDVTISEKGDLITIEKEIAIKDLPKAVTAGVEKKYPRATYKVAEEVIKVEKKKEKLDYYEVLIVTADKKKLELQVSPEGKILKEEKKGAKDD